MAAHDYVIEPLTVHTWDAFAAMVDRHNGIFGGCWCTYFHPSCADRQPGAVGSKQMKRQLVEAGRAHAALVMDGTDAIAWAEFGTPEELPNIHHRKQYDAEADLIPGTRTMYEEAGFAHIRSKGLKNTVMRRTITPA